MKTRLGKFLLFTASTLLALVLAEFLIRVFLPQDKIVTWIEMHPRGFMMNQKNIDAIHYFNDRELRYQLNEIGLRGKESFQNDKTNILLLGDSFTFGLLLEQNDTFASILQNNLSTNFPKQQVQVLNGGVGGAGLADWPGWLENNGSNISPDFIILYLNYMDVDRALSKNLYVVGDDSTLVNSIRWEPRKFFMSLGRMEWYRLLQEYSELMNILVKIAWRHLYFSDQTSSFSQQDSEVPIPPDESFDPESGYSLQLAQLLTKKMADWCKQKNCTLIVTTTGFFDANSTGVHTLKYYEFLANEAERSIPFFDNTPCVKEKTGSDFDAITIPEDTHPDEIGAKIIAKCSMKWLQPFLEQNMGKP